MKTQFSALLASAAFATGAVVTMMVAPAQAFTGICQNDQITYTSGDQKIAASAYRGEIETKDFGNDLEGDGNPLLGRWNTLFGTDYNWSFVGKDETAGIQAPFDGYVGDETKSGAWSVSNPITGPFAISVKASIGFAVYLFEKISEASNILGGNWYTASLRVDGGQGNQPELSHISLFTVLSSSVTPDPTPVPEPASVVGLGLVASGIFIWKSLTQLLDSELEMQVY